MSIKERKNMKFGRGEYRDDPEARQRRQFKAARLIVRNLPFTSTEENLKEHFSQFGNVAEVKLLRKGTKLVGCGFVQFDNKLNAAKAIQKASGKEFKGRVIIADWAVPKDQFIRAQQEVIKSQVKDEPLDESEIKQEVESDDDVSIKEEPESDNESESGNKDWNEIKSESDEENSDEDSDSEEEVKIKSRKRLKSDSEDLDSDEADSDEEDNDSEDTKSRKRVKSNSDEDSNGDLDEEDSEEDFDDDDEEEESDEDIKPDVSKLKKRKSNDVSEGKTVFIKNVPFMATEEELKKAVEKFGPIYYAKICIDPMTEHSKGTAFVKFKSVESAESCLKAGNDLTMNGAVLEPHPALAKKEIVNKRNQPKQPSDSRNLYLLKEGVVMAGSKAAEGVSGSDMAKRLDIERWKRQIIKDLGKFVSRNRLVIHNIPLYYDDKKTALLVKKYCPRTARFREVRVMRDLKNLDANGVGKSKGFAFVTFDKHEDALATLRALNNNPTVFKPQKRPIVSFSVESRKALKIKEARLEKSRQVRATLNNKPEVKLEKDTIKLEKNNKFKDKRDKKKSKTSEESMDVDEERNNTPKYSGSFATPGSKKFINNLSVKKQAQLHRKELKREKTKVKLSKKKLPRKIRKQMKMENMTRQKKFDREDKAFTSLVDKYRSQILKSENKKKWFE